MINIHNGEATAQLTGYGTIDATIHYISLIATSTVVKSFKASLIQGKMHSIDGRGSRRRNKDHKWADFKSAIPGTPFIHYVFTSLAPETLLLVNPQKAATFADLWNHQPAADRTKALDEFRKFTQQHAPALLRHNLNEHTPFPIPPEWEAALFERAAHERLLSSATFEGDCAWLARRSTDNERWHAVIRDMLRAGIVQ